MTLSRYFTGAFQQAKTRAVAGGKTFSNAKDIVDWASNDAFSTPKDGAIRKFFLVKRGEINRQRPEVDVGTLKGTRKFHQVNND